MQKGIIISDNIEKYKEEIKSRLSSKYLLHFSYDINLLLKAVVSGGLSFVAFDPNTLFIDFIKFFSKVKSLYGKIPVFLISNNSISSKIPPIVERFISYKIDEAFYLEDDINNFIDSLSNLPIQEDDKKIHLLYSSLIGQSENTENLRLFVSNVAKNESPVLLLGATGCGKSKVARLIHDLSSRKNRNFQSIDMGSIPSQLVESTLFGSKKGAYTDAYRDTRGLIEQANNGTLFLDEIENMSLEIQMKLLNVLETRKVRAVGDDVEKEVNFRLICASNRDLKNMVSKGLFREDLYYRIKVLSFKIQALCDRKVDIEELAKFYTQKLNIEISKEAISKLERGNFKGNIRELFFVIERASIKAQKLQTIYPEHIFLES